MSSINTNLAAMMAQRSLASSQGAIARAMEHLATGKRINRGADDPAGLIAADRLGAQRVSLEEIIKKATHAGSMLDTADGALSSIEDLLTDLNGRIVQSANTAVEGADGRAALQVQAGSALQTIQRIIDTTTFDGKAILVKGAGELINGAWVGIRALDPFKLGRVEQEIPPDSGTPTPQAYSLMDLLKDGGLNLETGDLKLAQESVEGAAKEIAAIRGQIGAMRKYTLGRQVDALQVEHENTAAAESKIRDADFAQETADLARGQVLQQASIYVLQAAQQQGLRALSLLG